MLLIRALLLWSIISLHVVGGAAVFRRLFPRESPWFGFFVPALALVLLMNFVEHAVAIPSLLWLLPFTTVGFIWALLHPKLNWKGLRLPTGIFLASFAFTLTLRALRPDIPDLRDGIVDLGVMSSFCLGEKVPPPISWEPDLPLSHYYTLGHYAMSVLTRLLGLDVGTGFNLSSALLSAFDCLLAAAAAWRVSRHKIWITLLAPILMEGAATGATVYLWLTTTKFNPNQADDIFSGMDDFNNNSPILKWLHDTGRNELMPPGAWSWVGSFHSTCGGLFLVLFFVCSMMEVLRRRATNWPWICLGAIPLLTIGTSTWVFPFEVLLLLGTLFWIWYYRLFPQSFRFVLVGLGLATVFLTPMLSEFLATPLDFVRCEWTGAERRTQLVEFLILWWPIYLPLFALALVWPKQSPAVKTILFSLPVAYFFVEIFTVANRYDWTGKLWCPIFGVGWITLVPAVCRRRGIPFRLLTLILIVSSLCSFCAWTSFVWRVNAWGNGDMLHLEGTGPYRWDTVRCRLLQTLSRVKGQTILTGKTESSTSPALAAFTGNRIYIAWWSCVDAILSGASAPDIPRHQGEEVNDFYDGKCDDPLFFLRTHDISAVVIFPEDKISTDVLENLKKNLTPYYEYVDCHEGEVNAGIFFFHPEMLKWPAALILHSPHPNPPVITSALAMHGILGAQFNFTITADHNPASYGAIGLPAGLTLDPDTGVITGTVTATKSSTVTLTSTNAGGTGEAKLILTFNSPDGLSVVDGLTIWLRADSGVQLDGNGTVSRWSDLTSNSNDAEQDAPGSRPTVLAHAIQGQPAIHFDGATTFLATAPSIQDDFSIFVVFRSSTGVGGGEQWFQGAGIVDADVPGSKNDFGLSLNANGEVLTGVGNPDTSLASLRGGYNDGKPHTAAFIRSKGTGAFAQYVDSIFQGTVVGNTASLTDPTSIAIGATRTLDQYFGGDIAEVLVYNRVLVTPERQQVESYLMNKYGPSPATKNVAKAAGVTQK